MHMPSPSTLKPKKRKRDYDRAETQPTGLVEDAETIKMSIAPSPKRQRHHKASLISLGKPPIDPKAVQTAHYTTLNSLLGRCHICHRRPMTKIDLAGFADCDDCGSRTCYICMRECEEPECRKSPHSYHVDQPHNGSEPNHHTSKTRGSGGRLCRNCAIEYIYADGTDMTRCLQCAKVRSLRDSSHSRSEMQPP